MIAAGLNLFLYFAIASILVFLAAVIAKRRYGVSLKSLISGIRLKTSSATDRIFEKRRIPTLKKCGNCSEQLPLSALMCDACGYNFLSGMVGRGHKMLPAPETPTQEVAKQSFASAGA